MSLYRSEEMTLAQLFLQSEAAYACVRELGELGRVQFRDLNKDVNAFQRKFMSELRRCDDMERKLRFLHNELDKAGILPWPAGNVEAPEHQAMMDLESQFEKLENEVIQMKSNKATLRNNLLELIELRHILKKTQGFFLEVHRDQLSANKGNELLITDEEAARGFLESDGEMLLSLTKFTFITGVIVRERMATFERVIWRACRGNVFVRHAEIEEAMEDPITGNEMHKIVFILFFQGDQLQRRARKICEGFHATLYQCPSKASERAEMARAVGNRIHELESVLGTSYQHSRAQLTLIARDISTWEQKVKKVKAIYHAMNMFNLDVTQRCLIAECWCPVEDLDKIKQVLARGTERSGSTVPSILHKMRTAETPPTYFKTNKFTEGFQSIVEAYGVASYQEINPTPYTLITFPFIFAVMFGDAGHGLLMSLFALILILFEKKFQQGRGRGGGEMFDPIFNGRYIILLMGLFSIYTGIIYNDVFSKSLNLFGTSWNASFSEGHFKFHSKGGCCPPGANCVITTTELTLFPREAMAPNQPYPIGIDPIWQLSNNKLEFLNSYKMKMSVIVGISQMLFGLVLSLLNHLHFKRRINIYLEFVPQMLFLLCIFGWLVFLIFIKWLRFYDTGRHAPSLLITLIDMFLAFGQHPDGVEVYSTFGTGDGAATFQRVVQAMLVVVAMLCVPWMLFGRPAYLYWQRLSRNRKSGYRRTYTITVFDPEEAQAILHHDDDDQPLAKKEEVEEEREEGEEHDLGELFIHQAIHTIEYCLGTISNTASYLRLWALSLAHAQLSEVLWFMVLRIGFTSGSSILLAFLFAFWAVLTVGILLGMEGLSAFLHALRLHWVEFQNKFYSGSGTKFMPFSFKTILAGNDEL